MGKNVIPTKLFRNLGIAVAILPVPVTLFLFRPGPVVTDRSPASKGGGGCTDASVTTTINDRDAHGLASTVLSDGLGSYPNGVNGVTSILTCNGYKGIKHGDWQFNKSLSTKRHVGFDFERNDAVQSGDPHYVRPANPPFWGTQVLQGALEVKCTFVNNNMLAMTASSSFTCPMIVAYFYSGDRYGYHPYHSFDPTHPETTDVQIVCNSADSGGCNDWYIDPIDQRGAVGVMGGGTPQTPRGDFYMRFHIHITRP